MFTSDVPFCTNDMNSQCRSHVNGHTFFTPLPVNIISSFYHRISIDLHKDKFDFPMNINKITLHALL